MRHRMSTMRTRVSALAVVAVVAMMAGAISTAACAGVVPSGTAAAADAADDSGTAAGQRLFTPEELRRDLSQFRRIVEKKAVGTYADRAELATALEAADRAVQSPMSELEFYRILSPALAALRCGHSFLDPSKGEEARMRTEGRFFPLTVRIVDGRLYAVADPYGTGVPPGSELLSINGRSATELFGHIASRLTTDGDDEGRPRYDAERWFAGMYYALIGEPESFDVEYRSPDGEPAVAALAPVRDARLAKTAMGVIFDTLDQRPGHAFNEGYAYLRVPVFSAPDQRAYESYLSDFFAELRARGDDTLVLDLRGNYGGSPPSTVALFRYLIDRPLPFFAAGHLLLLPLQLGQKPAEAAFNGRLYVLMDEAGFSMNGFILSLLKYHGIGTLVGAPSSGGFRCSDSSMNAVLKETGIRVRYSTAMYEVAVSGMEPGIGVAPDILVVPTLDDYLSGRDAALEAALGAAGL